MLTPDTLIHGRYRVLQQIGIGGMGAVYKAIDVRLRHAVAVKHMLTKRVPTYVRAFEREARLLAHLHHPALPIVSDYFIDDNGHFLVMQFIDGEDLATMLTTRSEPFEVNEVLSWADTLLDALIYLHSQEPQIIHRDIKPQNLKLTPRGQIMLLDFGLAKGMVDPLSPETSGSSVYGYTLHYSSIEQIQGLGTNARSDLYALAATMYHLLTGSLPPNAPTRVMALMAGQPDPLRPAHEYNPLVPTKVSDVLFRALAIHAHTRFEGAAALRVALRDAYSLPDNTLHLASAVGSNRTTVRIQSQPSKIHVSEVAGKQHSTNQYLLAPRVEAQEGVKIGKSTLPRQRPRIPTTREFPLALFIGSVSSVALVVFLALISVMQIPHPQLVAGVSVLFYLGLIAVLAYTDPQSLYKISVRTIGNHTDAVSHIGFAPNGALLASASMDATIQVWHIPNARRMYTCASHKATVRHFSFTPNGQIMISASDDTTIRLWRAQDGELLHTLKGHTSRVWSTAVSPDGQIVASASDDATVRLWRVHDGRLLYTLTGHTGAVWNLEFSPDGHILASAGEDSTVRLWHVDDHAPYHTMIGHAGGICSIAFSPDGSMLASSSHDATVRIWRTSDGELLHVLQGHTLTVGGVAFHPGGQLLASRSEDTTIRLWRVHDGALLHTLQGHERYVSGFAFAPNGYILVSVSWDARTIVWRVRDGQMLTHRRGHSARICNVAYSTDGRRFATGSLDRSVRLWEVH